MVNRAVPDGPARGCRLPTLSRWNRQRTRTNMVMLGALMANMDILRSALERALKRIPLTPAKFVEMNTRAGARGEYKAK